MIKTPLLNTKLVQHMDVPMIPDVLMLNAGESLEGALFRRGDLLDALSVDIYFKDVESRLHNVFDVVTTKLRNHISDTYCHTNPDEKRYWNNKLDKNDFDSAFAVLKSRLDGYEGSLDDIRSILNSLPDFDLYALKTDLKDFITGDDLEDILKNIGLIDEDGAPIIDVDTITNIINNADLSNYVKKGSILGTINGIEFREGSSITISGGTSPSGDLYLTANDLKTINGQSIVGTGDIVIDGDGSSFVLNPATSTKLGGIKIGYERGSNDSDRNYAVQLSPDNKAYVYVPWINTPGGDDPDNPDDPGENKDKIITLTESEFNALDNAGELLPNTTYIVLDDDTRIVKFICYVDEYGVKHITTMPEGSSEELKVEEVTLEQWNNMTNKDPNTIYIVYSGTGANRALVGLGISTVLTRIPIPANGIVVRLTQLEYDNLGADIDEGTLYLIVANNAVVKMYLGSIEIPVGSESEVGVIKSILTNMFSEKITWSGDRVESLNWSIIDVDNPGEFYAATGFEDLVKNTVKEAGFISKTDNTDNFAEMFATQVGLNGDIVKKASIIASINDSGESNVKISADKININGIFNQYAQSADKKSASQLLSDGNSIIGRVSVIDNGVLRATEVQQHPGEFTISAVSVDNNNSETSNALFSIKTATKGSEVLISADSVVLDGNTTVSGKLSALSANFDSLQANYASIENVYATKVDVNTLLANYATIGYLTGGNAEFDGKVHATEFAAGDSGSANMAINGENIEFYFGNERRAYFSQGEDNRGMQLHIMNADGTWYIIDFTNGTWSSDGGGSTQYAYYSPATRSNLHVMQSTPLYYKNGIYYTDTQLANRANKTYYTQTEVYNRDGEGEALYGVVSDSNNEIHVAAYVKNLIRYESVEFSNGAIVSSQTKYIYTGRAPKQLVLKADGTPSNINYDNVDTMLVSVESNVNTQWLYNGYTNGIVLDTNTIINPVISGTYAQISNAGFSEYEVLDLGSQFAPQLIFIDEDDELTW